MELKIADLEIGNIIKNLGSGSEYVVVANQHGVVAGVATRVISVNDPEIKRWRKVSDHDSVLTSPDGLGYQIVWQDFTVTVATRTIAIANPTEWARVR